METRVLALKNNHGILRRGVEQTFAQALVGELTGIQPHFYETAEKGHGRIEIRQHWMIDDKEIIARLDRKSGHGRDCVVSGWFNRSAQLDKK
jgi:predicted transposase YbfD/YdcC